MVATVFEWNTTYRRLESQIELFNTGVQENKLFREMDIEKIYKIVEEETKRLKALSKVATAMESKLQKKNCCCYSLCTVALLSVISKVILIGGAAIPLIHVSDPVEALKISLGIAIGTAIFDLSSNLLIFKSSVDDSENRIQLARLDKQGVKHAKIFKKFLKELMKVNQLQNELLEAQRSSQHSLSQDHVVIPLLSSSKNLDDHISACLQQYEELPPGYRKEESYCRIIRLFIERLPQDDPLRISFMGLETNPQLESIAREVGQPLRVHYLPTTQDVTSDNDWVVEEQANPNVNQAKVDFQAEPEKRNLELEIAAFKHSVAKRFHLKHNMPYVETPHGVRVGITNKSSVEEKT